MSNTIVVTVTSSPRPSPNGGPVPAVVTVRNSGNQAASVLLPYPNLNHLSFECSAAGFTQPKTVGFLESERTAPIVIQPRTAYTATYFLNRYLRFLKAGEAEVRYELSMVINNEDAVYRGGFPVELADVSDYQLRATLSGYAARLRDPDRKVKMEAAEALAFLDTPLVVPYLILMLNIDNLEIIGIEALGHHRSPESERAIASMLEHPDSGVVGAALQEIDRGKISIPRAAIHRLLSAPNGNTQWLALGWLAERPDRGDLPLLAPLLASSNEAVRSRATEYEKALKAR